MSEGNKGLASARTAGALDEPKAPPINVCEIGERRDGSVWMAFFPPLVGGHYQADFEFPFGVAAKVQRAVNCHDDLLGALKDVVRELIFGRVSNTTTMRALEAIRNATSPSPTKGK